MERIKTALTRRRRVDDTLSLGRACNFSIKWRVNCFFFEKFTTVRQLLIAAMNKTSNVARRFY